MERILRSKEMAEIILLPVRHHSPACALQVSRMIEKSRPSVILVEGPTNANPLTSVMVHEDTKAPFAIYYSYHDTAGRITEEKEHYKCYYPFLDYSPELVALREGKQLGIPALFIDLSYGDILVASEEGKGLLKKEDEKSNYNDDYLLSENKYLKQLCENTGMRSFEEFWEKYFELNGIYEESEKWFSDLLAYCTQARENTPRKSMEEDGCLARERFMAAQILKQARERASEEGPVLVVTGGFHTPGLKALLEELSALLTAKGKKPAKRSKASALKSNASLEAKSSTLESNASLEAKSSTLESNASLESKSSILGLNVSLEENASIGAKSSILESNASNEAYEKETAAKVSTKDQGVYLMPYSMEAADALNGYASGMPFTGFYQKIWDAMKETETPYENVVLDMLVASGKETRKKEGYLSTYDEICACTMARGLADLRGKREPGAYELMDAVMSSFIKGEYNIATDTPMRILRKHMTGNAIGALCKDADVPPVIHDFTAQCKKFGLKANSTIETEVTLSIFSNRRHRQQSMFFNRMNFLNTGFARKVKGPNLQLKKDRNLLREIWRYRWNAQVNAALIDVSVYGATIEEAAGSVVKEELKKEMGARESALLLTHVFEMGLREQLRPVYDRVHELMLQDTDFYSIAEALQSLMMMEELSSLYDSELEFGNLIHLGCRKLIALLPSMASIKDEDLTECMNALKLLYQLTGRNAEQFGQEREDFYAALQKMISDANIHSGLNGCIHGILYGSGKETAAEVEMVCRGYLMGTEEQLLKTAQFFKGLFYTARDLVFIGNQFLEVLDQFFGMVGEEEFMQMLPELRMAFTYFTPREIDKIAQMAAGLHGKEGDDILNRTEVYPEWYSYGKEMDDYVKGRMEANRHG